MVRVGAVNAFGRAIITITKNLKLLIIPLIVSLLLSPFSAYLFRETSVFENLWGVSGGSNESVIFEEHGSTISEEVLNEMAEFFRLFLVFMLVSLLLQALSEYAIVKGALMVEDNQTYSLVDLVYEGIHHVFQVFFVNLLVGIITIIILLGPMLLFSALIVLTGSSVLMWLLLLVEFPLILLLVAAGSMAVPIYVMSNSITASLSCFSIAFKNKLSSIGFGAFLVVSGFLLLAVPASFIGLLFLGKSDFTANLISNILQSPFQALIQTLMAIGGLMLYFELTKKVKSFEEEIMEEFGL
ncbi:hypothetical protein K1720_09905 [Thermococcus argininiproducens]|uniref:Uncharacterized protein n=1 Tax=Thermococcus argininiproducens TaxID=2866384 RepID=A0A9E7M9E6_9EURY|nr:hypothetical protein [Thermococcus argininiproducens]USG99789.1 hypothetical protein K1720_09905 [Thermococcus argininiproducens]